MGLGVRVGPRLEVTHMGITPLTFTGVSQFSDDFQAIVARTVAVASLPVKALQNDQQTALAKKTALIDMQFAVRDLASSLKRLATLGDQRSLAATSNSPKVAASITDSAAATAGLYRITDVTSLASRASATSTMGVYDATSTPITASPHEMRLIVGGEEFNFTLGAGENNLEGIKNRINGLNAGVTASILNTGDPSAPYFLSISAVDAGANDIELRTSPGDSGSNLLTQTAPGSDAVFKVNGQTVTSTSNIISSVIPGVTFRLSDITTAGEQISLEVATSADPVVSELQKFAAAYNALSTKLGSHTGDAGGALTGDAMLTSIRRNMSEMFGSLGSGALHSITDLGISIDNDGVMTFDKTNISSASPQKLAEILSLVSSNGLGSLADSFDYYSNPVSGAFEQRLSSLSETDKRLQEQIDKLVERVNQTQATLFLRLQAADTLLARLESQQSLLDATIESLNYSTYGRKDR